MQIASYHGISFRSRAIRCITRSDYSHSCFLFDKQTVAAIDAVKRAGILLPKIIFPAVGAVIETWNPSISNALSINSNHTPGTVVDVFDLCEPLLMVEEMQLVRDLHADIGDAVDWKQCRRFLVKKPGVEADPWFSSEHVFQRLHDIGRVLFRNTTAWEVSPGLITRSPLLKLSASYLTVHTKSSV